MQKHDDTIDKITMTSIIRSVAKEEDERYSLIS